MTSSSDATAPQRHRLAAAGARAASVRAASPVRVIDRAPPPSPPPQVDVAGLAKAMGDGFAAVQAQVERAFLEIEKECVELAFAAAEHVMRRKAARGELELEEPLRELLDTRRRELLELPAVLHLHPQDAQAIAPRVEELAPPGARVIVMADPAQPRGDVVLELGAGKLVRSLENDLRQLRQRLLQEGDAR
jgi:flagellar biosynthesis/type III secretory pathway protein FliH